MHVCWSLPVALLASMCSHMFLRMCVCVLKYPAHFPTSPHLDDTALDSITHSVTSWSVRGSLTEHPPAAKYVFLFFFSCFDWCKCLRFYGNGREGCCVSGDAEPSQHDVAVSTHYFTPSSCDSFSCAFQTMSVLSVKLFVQSSFSPYFLFSSRVCFRCL